MIQRCAIVGGGISGLAAAYFLQNRLPDVICDIYEAEPRIGGVIRTEKISGCIVEGGPDSFLTIKKTASRLCQAIGLGSELVGSNDHSRTTFIVDDGELKQLPEGFFMMVPTRLRSLVTTNLLSWPGKLEALSDLFCFPQHQDCVVSEFIERRFGTEVLRKVAEPMISGIYGANVNRLSVQSALPQIWELQQKGSIIAQLMRRKAGQTPESLFTTLENGMESLIVRLQETIRANWKLGQTVETITRFKTGWKIGDDLYDAILMAGSRLPFIDVPEFTELEAAWNSTQKNSAVVVVLAFSGLWQNGFGWLVPARERRSVLACTYLSNKFPRRSPDHMFLVRAFIGGDEAKEWIQRTDENVTTEVLSELSRIAGIIGNPLFSRIFRWHNAMPEYGLNHRSKIERINNLIRLNKGLYATGNIFSGVGIPDCIQHAEKVVMDVGAGLRSAH